MYLILMSLNKRLTNKKCPEPNNRQFFRELNPGPLVSSNRYTTYILDCPSI